MSVFASKENTILFGGVSVGKSQFDFNDHSWRVSSVKTTNIALIILVVTTVSLRLFARIKSVHNLFTDDVLILLATVFTVALASTCIAVTTTVGLGKHIWFLSIAAILQTMKNYMLVGYYQVIHERLLASKISVSTSVRCFIVAPLH
ncbi:hypothetical protein AA0116_g12698 [Alternaria tenuissima]|nr:hypothetical protein AA0116_g12698 [Alternaria tenuissima]